MAVSSTMLALGTPAPDFKLKDPAGSLVRRDDFASAPALLVTFICNHCPYVKHVRAQFAALAREYIGRGVAIVAINPNDPTSHPEDGPEGMAAIAKELDFRFPYVIDETQDVAKAYRAACTPDFFLFDKSRRLVYRGQMDDSRPGNNVPVTGKDLRAALDAVLTGRKVSEKQKPSIGCSIKWKPGNEPA